MKYQAMAREVRTPTNDSQRPADGPTSPGEGKDVWTRTNASTATSGLGQGKQMCWPPRSRLADNGN